MNGTGWLVGTQLRRGWRSYVGLALLVGLAGGLVIAGFAGARRNATAFDRMIEATDGWDVLINPDQGLDSALTLDQVTALPQVAAAGRVDGMSALRADVHSILDAEDSPIVLAGDGDAYYDVGRPLVREGALPDPDDPDAVVLDQRVAARWGLAVGDELPLRLLRGEELYAAGPDTDLAEVGTVVPARVAAIAVTQDSVANIEGGYTQWMAVTPALLRAHPEASAGYFGIVAKLRSGADVAAVRAALTDGRPLDDQLVFQTVGAVRDEVSATITPQTAVLLVFSAVALLLGVLIVGQAVWRRLQMDGEDGATLAAVGVTHRQRFGAALVRIAVMASAGAALAVVIAGSLSTLTPIGDARLAEPTPGLDLNWAYLGVGALAVVAVTVLCAVLPAWRTTSVAADPAPARPSWAVARVAGSGAGPSTVAGVRFALDPGRGRTSVPVRTTLIGAVSGIMIIAASLTFAGSLEHLTSTPAEYGAVANGELDWDGEPPDALVAAGALDDSPDVDAWGVVTIGEFGTAGQRVQYVQPQAGDLPAAQLASGRAPGDGEVVLGRRTLDGLGLSVGDTMQADTASGPRRSEGGGDRRVPAAVVLSGLGQVGGGHRGLDRRGGRRGRADRGGPGRQPAGVAVVAGRDRPGPTGGGTAAADGLRRGRDRGEGVAPGVTRAGPVGVGPDAAVPVVPVVCVGGGDGGPRADRSGVASSS